MERHEHEQHAVAIERHPVAAARPGRPTGGVDLAVAGVDEPGLRAPAEPSERVAQGVGVQAVVRVDLRDEAAAGGGEGVAQTRCEGLMRGSHDAAAGVATDRGLGRGGRVVGAAVAPHDQLGVGLTLR